MEETIAMSHAEVAAKLRRAATASSNNTGGSSSGGLKRATMRQGRDSNVGGGGGESNGTRRLLHWTSQQWRVFEGTPKYGKVLNAARILPIRAPLSSLYEIHFEGEQATSPSALMETMLAASKSGTPVDIGLVIDATGSEHFLYDTKEWEDWDVEYVKLSGRLSEEKQEEDGDQARIEVENTIVTQFCEQVEKHLSSEHKDRDVAVYGASGYNFVGYMIVRYLIEYCGLPLHKALEEYATSIPPGIYSRYYLERLYRQYFATLPSSASTIKIRPPPKWDVLAPTINPVLAKIGSDCLREEDHQNKYVPKLINAARHNKPTHDKDTSVETPSSNTTPTHRSSLTAPSYKPPMYIPPDRQECERAAKRRKIRTWIDDVEPTDFGDRLDPASEEHQSVFKALTKMTNVEGFPGCETIPLTATHVSTDAHKKRGCLTSSYLVTWRARGRRCLLFTTVDGVYVVSRDVTFTKVNMKFPRRRAVTETHVNTLIDGIVVQDRDVDGHSVARFLAFDLVFLEGVPLWQKKLEKRLQALQNEVILPRKNDTSFDYTQETFRVRMKDHFRLNKTEFLLHKFVQDVTHEVDGVIFTPTDAPYNLGGFESDDPIFKFVSSEAGGGIPGFDGSISERKLLQYIATVPHK